MGLLPPLAPLLRAGRTRPRGALEPLHTAGIKDEEVAARGIELGPLTLADAVLARRRRPA